MSQPNPPKILEETLVAVFSDSDHMIGTNESVAIQIARERLQTLTAKAIPETVTRRKLGKMYKDMEIDWNKYCSELAFTEAVETMSDNLKKVGLL